MSKKKADNADADEPSTSLHYTANPKIRMPLSMKKKTNALKHDVQVSLDEMVCKFFAKTGLSSDTVRDPAFIQLIYMLNKDYSPPTPSTVDYELEVLSNKLKATKRSTDLEKFTQPNCVTIDTLKQGLDVYLAFSLHYFIDGLPRKNVVHLRKMNTIDVDPALVLDEIQTAANEICSKKIRFPTLVTTNQEITDHFHSVNIIDRSYTCYYTYITNFAEAILRIPQFDKALNRLKTFFIEVKQDTDFQFKISKFFFANKMCFELPSVDLNKWTEIADFLSNVLQYHRYMSDLSLRCNNHYDYIDELVYDQLMSLQTVLSFLSNSVIELAKSDSYLSQILPELSKIKRLISEDLSADDFLQTKIALEFGTFLRPLMDPNFKGGAYQFATFLDPRYCLDTEIFGSETWDNLAEHVKNYLLTSSVGATMSKRDRKTKIEAELYNFQLMAKKQRPLVNPFNWWKIYAKRFSLLFELAKMYMISPPCAIDVDQYFGKRGKFISNDNKMTFSQFNNSLLVATPLETFRGRGYNDKNIGLEPIAIDKGLLVNVAKQVRAPVIKKKKPVIPEDIPSSSAKTANHTTTPANYTSLIDFNAPKSAQNEGGVLDYSAYYMQQPEVKQEPIESNDGYTGSMEYDVTTNTTNVPTNIVKIELDADLNKVKIEPIDEGVLPVTQQPSTSKTATTSGPVFKQKSPYVSTRKDDATTAAINMEEINDIMRPVDRRVFIKVPYKRKAMERVLERSTNEPTFVSIDFVGSSQSALPASCLKRPFDPKFGSSSVVTESNRKYKRICTNFETDHGIIRKERIYPMSTPTSLESITIARPQNIRNLPTGPVVKMIVPKVENEMRIVKPTPPETVKMEEVNVKVES